MKEEVIKEAIKDGDNVLKYVNNENDVDMICDIICEPKDNKDPFWYDMAKTLLKAIILYLKDTDNENVSIQRCKEIVEKTITSDEPRKIMEELLVEFDNNSNVKNLYRSIEIAPEKTFISIYNTLDECLNVVKTDKSFYKDELIVGIVDESEIEWKNNAINKIAKLENRDFNDIQCNERFFKEYNALELFVKGQRGGWIYLVSKDGSYLKFGEYALCKPEYLQEVLNGFKNGNRTGNINEKVVEKITDQELKKIVEEVIGNNDPYWNEPVYEIVKKIMSLPSGTETTIIKLLDSSQYTSNQLFDIYLCVTRVCIKIGIVLKFHKDNAKVDGLLYKLPFFIKRILKCPNCGEKLSYLMPSGSYLHCDKCNKYYKYDNGNVGTQTETPYNRNDVMY